MKSMVRIVVRASAVWALLVPLGGAASANQDGEAIRAAIASSDRPERDTRDDANRKPGEILTFAGLEPGMTVIDVNSGGGYYSEILSRIVGDEGRVYAHNGEVYWSFVKNNIGPRYDDRLENVTQVHDSEIVDIPAESADMAISVLAYHDYFFKHAARNNEIADVDAALKSIYDGLKPGGTFVIIDHAAKGGTTENAGDTLHRIDPELVRARVEKAGFTFEKESDIFWNSADDLEISPFDPSIRRKTHRFVHMYRK